MSFFKSLFGFGSKESKEPAAPTEDYQGFVIRPTPYEADGQYQTAGSIEKEIDGVRQEHKFIRAERHPSVEEAVRFSVFKARQIIDEQGERIFK